VVVGCAALLAGTCSRAAIGPDHNARPYPTPDRLCDDHCLPFGFYTRPIYAAGTINIIK
jgi:hypothetical protein